MEEASLHLSELNIANVHPDPPVHFLFILDRSYSMSGQKWKNLMTSLRTMAAWRQQLPHCHKDRVSAICYHNQAWVCVYQKSWAEFLTSSSAFTGNFFEPTYFA